MKELLGYFLIAQAIITGIIVYSIQRLSDSISESADYVVTRNGSVSWGTDFGIPTFSLFLLICVAGFGIFLILKKK